MPRVSVDDMVDAIREAKPKPLTASEIADATGVSQQAISARRDELEADERVEYGQVGNATAYWLKAWGDERTPKDPPNDLEAVANGGTLTRSARQGASRQPRTDGGMDRYEQAIPMSAMLFLFFGALVGAFGGPTWVFLMAVGVGGVTYLLHVYDIGEEIDAKLEEHGGVRGYWANYRDEIRLHPDEPQTPVERVARLDVLAFELILVAAVTMTLTIGVPVWVLGAGAYVSAITPTAALLLLFVVIGGLYVGMALLWVSMLAVIAIDAARWASRRSWLPGWVSR